MGNTLAILPCGLFTLTFLHYSILLSTITDFLSVPATFTRKTSWSQMSTLIHASASAGESSGPTFATTFAQYLFIVDHPAWDESHPLRKRNVRDQATFDELIREAETGLQPSARFTVFISHLQCLRHLRLQIESPITFSALYFLLFTHIFGENEGFSGQYYRALTEKSILKQDNERFEKENRVWLEVRKVLGEDVVGRNLWLGEFKDLVSKYLDRFDDGGIVREWMASINWIESILGTRARGNFLSSPIDLVTASPGSSWLGMGHLFHGSSWCCTLLPSFGLCFSLFSVGILVKVTYMIWTSQNLRGLTHLSLVKIHCSRRPITGTFPWNKTIFDHILHATAC